MPEELNRVVADHLSTLLLCPSATAVANLSAEGITGGVHMVGDVMYDAVLNFVGVARSRSTVLRRLNVEPGRYLLATVHRAENTDDAARLREILKAFAQISETIVFPVHPRTLKALSSQDVSAGGEESSAGAGGGALALPSNVRVIEPVGYLDMLMLEQHARVILTDSGGVQKEAYWLGVPCVTLRDETEWVETLETGWNVLTGVDAARIVEAVGARRPDAHAKPQLYGDGRVAERCVRVLES
jgi:UDP-N-acetylglucosamine 2-epimerase